MRFDVIISNPPYQLADGGAQASARPIYHLFVEQAKKLNPRYLAMIVPSRWFSGGKGLDSFRDQMLHNKHLVSLTDFFDSTECFPGVDISGGVCYFLWSRDESKDCEVTSHFAGKISKVTRPLLQKNSNTFVRFNEAIPILNKVAQRKEPEFAHDISSRKPFGLTTSAKLHMNEHLGDVRVFAYPHNGYIPYNEVPTNQKWINEIKVCISYAYGERGSFPYLVIGKPFIAPVGTCCTETYLVVKICSSMEEAQNVISYMATKFFRFLVLMKKNTQHATKSVYEYVPNQDFTKSWTDEELYAKYELTADEINFIESMIRPMDLGGED